MKADIITKKKRELEKLDNESTSALNLVTSTINQLDNINSRIDVVLEEIKDAKKSLLDTEEGLLSRKAHNSRIAEKFKSLIEE